MGSSSVWLEPDWNDLQLGQKVNLLASPVFLDPKGHKNLLRTSVWGKCIVVLGELPSAHAYTLLQAMVVQLEGGIRIDISGGKLLVHQLPLESALNDTIEVCSGIGCLGLGLKAAGLTVQACNDKQSVWCQIQSAHGTKGVVCGDLGSVDTLASLHEKHSSPSLVAGGFSCQPWSLLGDMKRTSDDRFTALHYILQCAHFLRCHSILLECVPGAGQDEHVQQTLQEFCRLTGFRMTQTEAQLSDLVPIRRHRWWCLLVSPILPCPTFRPMPRLCDPGHASSSACLACQADR